MHCPNSSPPAVLRMPRRPGMRPTTFLPPRPRPKSGGAARSWSQAATATHSSLPPPARRFFIQFARARSPGLARQVRLRYGVDPHQVPDFIALRGDPSDKLPGVAGLGAAGAAQVLHTYGTLESALRAGRFPAQAKNLRLFRSIATMDRKARLPRLGEQKPTWRIAAALAREWELKQLAKRLEELAGQSGAAKFSR